MKNAHRRPGYKGAVGSNQYVRREVADPDEEAKLIQRISSMKSDSSNIGISGGGSGIDNDALSDTDDDELIELTEENPTDDNVVTELRSRFPREYADAVIDDSLSGNDVVYPDSDQDDLVRYISSKRDQGDLSSGVARVAAMQCRRGYSSQYADDMSSEINQLNDDLLRRIGI